MRRNSVTDWWNNGLVDGWIRGLLVSNAPIRPLIRHSINQSLQLSNT